jgi:4-hydroxyphenylacetate 3-monooxygenase
MLKTGAAHLESIRDGRAVYIGSERIKDVTSHPAFAEGAATVAAIYEAKRAPENLAITSYEEDGERFSSYYLRPRSQEDLRRRTRTHKIIADLTFGLFGRSPDHVPGIITGLAMKPEVLDRAGQGFSQNLLRHWDQMRRRDSYAAFAMVPPPGTRNPDIHSQERRANPGLRIVKETDDGVVVSGMKMLATGAVYANEILIGNLTPLAPEFKQYAVTTCIPCDAPGLSLWSRRPYAPTGREMDYPLSHRFDETDCVVVCKDVKVPWEKLFVHNDAELARNCYILTPANCIQNHQSNVRFWSKMSLVVGLASRIAQSSGIDTIPCGARTDGPACRARSHDRRAGAGPDRGLRGLAGQRVCLLQPTLPLCRAQLVPGAPHGDRRPPARVDGRQSIVDAGRRILARRSRAQGRVRGKLRHPLHGAGGAVEAAQARLGLSGLRVRRPPPAL